VQDVDRVRRQSLTICRQSVILNVLSNANLADTNLKSLLNGRIQSTDAKKGRQKHIILTVIIIYYIHFTLFNKLITDAMHS
jgi:hypothetical protein